MTFRFSRSYRGPVKAVIFDWAGTLLDYGSCAPVQAFIEVFKEQGVAIAAEHARGPMGTHKRDHIRAILKYPEVEKNFFQKFGRSANDADVEKIYVEFLPLQLKCLAAHSELIPGVLKLVDELKNRGIKIGSTTGYTREIMEAVVPQAKQQGLVLDCMVSASEVKEGRPAPWMCFENAHRLNVYPMQAIVKVGDTIADIDEGLNAGMWSVGIAKSGNEIGLSRAETEALSPPELKKRLEGAYKRLYAAGAHYVIDTACDLPNILKDIEDRLARGERP